MESKLIEKYQAIFNSAISRNLDYWSNQQFGKNVVEKENVFSALKFGIRNIENSPNIENLLKTHFFWIENLEDIGKWIRIINTHYLKFSNDKGFSLWTAHFLSILYWNVKNYKRSNEINLWIGAHKRIEEYPLLQASLYYQIGRTYLVQQQQSLAQKYARLALLAIEKVDEKNYLFGMVKNLLGMIYSKNNDSRAATRLFEEAEKFYLAENYPALLGESYHNLSREYLKVGNLKSALNYFGKAAQQNLKMEEWGKLRSIELSRGLLYYKLGRLDNALKAFQRGIDIEANQISSDKGWISLARGYMFLLQGKPELAKKDFEASFFYWEKLDKKDLLKYSTEAINLTYS